MKLNHKFYIHDYKHPKHVFEYNDNQHNSLHEKLNTKLYSESAIMSFS